MADRSEYARRYRAKLKADPIRWAAQKEKEAAYRHKRRTEYASEYKATFRFHNAKRKVGVKTREEYDKLLAITSCEICGEQATDIDHCHTTGKIRGRLCGACNSGLAFFKDDPWRMHKAIQYLQVHGS